MGDSAVHAVRPDGMSFWLVTGGPGGGGEALVLGESEPVVYSFELSRLLDPQVAAVVLLAKAAFGRGTKIVLQPDWDPGKLVWWLLRPRHTSSTLDNPDLGV